eukprot:gnl/MRDRNA2_/MRDRNA2_27435_c0_seq1.p1 gnl/MRDRNA2_/MRDRNA2_27435_c0~~gnl/MRDRNA2_/MRDRNA2_27435_c0_seq1.p1  ORF type:complete len:772 (-),score=155.78 gnl/MRDRNA2_/MRDRNA2_27435_c0_seq1:3-2318(-)
MMAQFLRNLWVRIAIVALPFLRATAQRTEACTNTTAGKDCAYVGAGNRIHRGSCRRVGQKNNSILVCLSDSDSMGDPTCEQGWLHHRSGVCCAQSCGGCEGERGTSTSCEERPGGELNCCVEAIHRLAPSCRQSSPPCVLPPSHGTQGRASPNSFVRKKDEEKQELEDADEEKTPFVSNEGLDKMGGSLFVGIAAGVSYVCLIVFCMRLRRFVPNVLHHPQKLEGMNPSRKSSGGIEKGQPVTCLSEGALQALNLQTGPVSKNKRQHIKDVVSDAEPVAPLPWDERAEGHCTKLVQLDEDPDSKAEQTDQQPASNEYDNAKTAVDRHQQCTRDAGEDSLKGNLNCEASGSNGNRMKATLDAEDLILHSNPLQKPVGLFELVLDKSSGADLGIEVAHRKHYLRIDAINECGLVADWNKKYPQNSLLEGDRIVEVNKIKGDARTLLKEVVQHKQLRLKLRRRKKVQHSDRLSQLACLVCGDRNSAGKVICYSRLTPQVWVQAFTGDFEEYVCEVQGQAYSSLCSKHRSLIGRIPADGAYAAVENVDYIKQSSAKMQGPDGCSSRSESSDTEKQQKRKKRSKKSESAKKKNQKTKEQSDAAITEGGSVHQEEDDRDVLMDSLNTILSHIDHSDSESFRIMREQPGKIWSSKTGVKDEAWRSKWDTMQDDLANTVGEGIDETHVKLIQNVEDAVPSVLCHVDGSTISGESDSATLDSGSVDDMQSKKAQRARVPAASWASKTGEKDAEWHKKWDDMQEDMGRVLQSEQHHEKLLV